MTELASAELSAERQAQLCELAALIEVIDTLNSVRLLVELSRRKGRVLDQLGLHLQQAGKRLSSTSNRQAL